MENTTESCNHCKSSINITETDFINCYDFINYFRYLTYVYYNCLKHNNSLIFEWNNRNNPPNYAIQLMRSPSLLYICPKCITFNNTLSPQLHIATQVSL